MEKLGVVARVEQPTDWCAGMVPKSNGKVCICVDLTKLNKSVRRERHPLPSFDQILAQLSGATIFSVGCELWILASSFISTLNNFYDSVWTFLFPQVAIWYHLGSRDLPTTDVPDVVRATWNHLQISLCTEPCRRNTMTALEEFCSEYKTRV